MCVSCWYGLCVSAKKKLLSFIDDAEKKRRVVPIAPIAPGGVPAPVRPSVPLTAPGAPPAMRISVAPAPSVSGAAVGYKGPGRYTGGIVDVFDPDEVVPGFIERAVDLGEDGLDYIEGAQIGAWGAAAALKLAPSIGVRAAPALSAISNTAGRVAAPLYGGLVLADAARTSLDGDYREASRVGGRDELGGGVFSDSAKLFGRAVSRPASLGGYFFGKVNQMSIDRTNEELKHNRQQLRMEYDLKRAQKAISEMDRREISRDGS